MQLDYPGSRDSRQFLMAKNAPLERGQQEPRQIHAVLNWFEELRRHEPLPK